MQTLTLRPFLQTSQVILRPIEKKDLKTYQTLFQDTTAMRLHAGGPRDITKRFHNWIQRWDIHPYSALAITDKVSKKVIGHAILGHGDYENNPYKGFSEIAIILAPSYWNTQYGDPKSGIGTAKKAHVGTEVIRTLINYAKSLKELAYKVPCDVTEKQQEALKRLCSNNKEWQVHKNRDGKIAWIYLPLKEIRATCDKANTAAHKIFHKVFVEENKGTVKPFSKERDLFTISLN